jgi:hypothetical protein
MATFVSWANAEPAAMIVAAANMETEVITGSILRMEISGR